MQRSALLASYSCRLTLAQTLKIPVRLHLSHPGPGAAHRGRSEGGPRSASSVSHAHVVRLQSVQGGILAEYHSL